jgi:hypothetical protein
MKRKKIFKIVAWVLAALLVVIGGLFSIGYFYYGELIRDYVVSAIKRDSKGLYEAEIGKISLDIVNGNLTVHQFSLTPDTSLYRKDGSDSLVPLLLKMSIREFSIRDFKVMDALRNKRIELDRIRFVAPELTIFRMRMSPAVKKDSTKRPMLAIPLPPGLSGIMIHHLSIEKAAMTFVDCLNDSVKTSLFPVTDISITEIIVDSAHTGTKRLFNADDISIRLGDYAFKDKKEMNKISFGEISLSTAANELIVKNFHLEPQYNAYDYPRKMGYQCDRTEVKIPEFRISRLNIRKLLFEGKLVAGLVKIDSIFIDDYRDMRVPELKGSKPPMPHEKIRSLKSYIRIDTISVTNGKAIYSEQVNDKPGSLFFDKMNITLTGLTNDSVLLHAGHFTELRGITYLMGEGKIDATMRFFIGDPKNTFTWSAQVGPMDLTKINAMLAYQLPARITSGKLQKLVIPFVKANDDVAAGKLIFYYNDLKVMMEGPEETTWGKVKNKLINFAANDLIVNNDNPTKSGKLKTGVIFFERNKNSSVFNYLWKSVLSGLKSTMGFNSDAQKAMIKAEKERQKK